jgi:hypothetical protein
MSNVTDMFVIIGDTENEHAETIAPKVAEAISAFIGLNNPLPVISLERDDWDSLQGSNKAAGSAVIWFGWNYAHPQELEEHLKAQGFTNITVWSHHEFAGMDGVAPRVVSW